MVYSFETGNHIKQQANGYRKTVLVPRQRDDGSASSELGSADIIVQSGSYSYTAPDGTIISVSYIADENGFRAFGDHLPTPPPIPELILQSLQNAQNSQLAEEQPTQQLLAPQGNSHFTDEPPKLNRLLIFNYILADIAIDAETATSQSDEKTRQQRSPLLPALLQ